jgi:hypothetical protein
MEYNRLEHPLYRVLKDERRKIKHGTSKWNNIDEVKQYLEEEAMKKEGIERADAVLFYLSLQQEGVHYFIENNELFEFLSNMEVKDIEAVKSAINTSYNFNGYCRLGDGNYLLHLYGSIHAKIQTPALSFCFLKDRAGNMTMFNMVGHKNITEGNDVAFYGEDFTISSIYGKPMLNNIKNTQLILNMLMYMAAYPEMVEYRAPESPTQYKGVYIKAHKSIEYVIKESPTAHYRRGHFRLLSDDRYIKKRGQIIYVRASFVNGQCVTIN